jgi:NAD(P)-dependent dehydrogenase (short-subunit alcohol dehydrogenase family)
MASSTSNSGHATNADLTRDILFDVSHVTAVVTGGATGIGLMITQALVANGAKVYITGRRQEKLDQTVSLYGEGAKGQLKALQGDVSTKEGCIKIAEEIGKLEPEGIQLLVNNAGIARDDATSFCEFLLSISLIAWSRRLFRSVHTDH